MSSSVTQILSGVGEVLVSATAGATAFFPIPPVALLMLPVCAISSLVSIASNAVFQKLLNPDDDAVGVKLAGKGISLLIGTAIASALATVVLLPISPGAALAVALVVALSSLVGAVAGVIIREAPDLYLYGFNYSFDFSPRVNVFSSTPAFGYRGAPSRGFSRSYR